MTLPIECSSFNVGMTTATVSVASSPSCDIVRGIGIPPLDHADVLARFSSVTPRMIHELGAQLRRRFSVLVHTY